MLEPRKTTDEDAPLCEECMDALATTDEWGPWLCDACATATAQGDGGAEA